MAKLVDLSTQYRGNPAGQHTDAPLTKNQVDATSFNNIENAIEALNEAAGDSGLKGLIDKLIGMARASDRAIQYDPDTYNSTVGNPTNVTIKVTSEDGTKEVFTTVTEVTAKIIQDTTGGATINGSTSPVVVTLTDGEGIISVADGGVAGSVDLGLEDSGGSGLDVVDEATVTFS